MKKKTSENHGRLLAGSVEKQIMTQTLIRYLKWNIETEVIAKLVMGLWSVGPKLQRPGPFCLDLDSPKQGPDVPMNTSFNIGNWKETSVKISGPCGLYYYSITQMSGTFFLSSFQIYIFQLHEKKTIYSGHSAT